MTETGARIPPGLRTADDVVGWCGTDAERLHLAYMEEVTRPAPQRRPGVAQAPTYVLGAVLRLLEDHGYIREASAPSTGGRRPVVYHVTPKGW